MRGVTQEEAKKERGERKATLPSPDYSPKELQGLLSGAKAGSQELSPVLPRGHRAKILASTLEFSQLSSNVSISRKLRVGSQKGVQTKAL